LFERSVILMRYDRDIFEEAIYNAFTV